MYGYEFKYVAYKCKVDECTYVWSSLCFNMVINSSIWLFEGVDLFMIVSIRLYESVSLFINVSAWL